MRPLITVEELASGLESIHICDIRWDLTDPDKGRAAYQEGHIPGAVFVDLDRDLSAPPGDAGRHPLPDPADFAATLGRLGISPASHVVAYDDVAGRIAARLWWMLRSIGHDGVQVLDGGYQAWVKAGLEVDGGTVVPKPTEYPVPDGFTGTVGHGELEGRTIIDARAAERYRGDLEPVDPKAGHIPGAINVPTSENVGENGHFHDATTLAGIYEGHESPVMSCGSGVTACHNALAMVTAGREMPDVYVGSFSEWSRLGFPVTTGSEP